MVKTRLATTALIISILFASAFAGTTMYYNSMVNDKSSQIASLNNQIANLKNETANLNNEITNLTDEIANLTSMRAKIINFSSEGPDSIVFGVSGYRFGITVTNIGNVILENMILKVNLTLSDGESSNWSSPINTQGIGESQQVSGSLIIQNVSVNLLNLSQTWTFVITTPKGNIIEQTYTT
jgi:cell division protein FtsB